MVLGKDRYPFRLKCFITVAAKTDSIEMSDKCKENLNDLLFALY